MKQHELPNIEPLVASLLERAPKMNFMQLCRLLEACAPANPGFGTRDTAEHELVRFRPRPRVGFPAGEIASVEFGDTEYPIGFAAVLSPPTVRTTFMGLYGVDAAMPPHMIDEIVLREEGHETVEAFLDLFNHRFITLLYRAWKKYRYPESFRAGGEDPHSRDLLCLTGFGWGDKPQRAGLPDSRMLAVLGLLILRTRTPEGLAGVVARVAPDAAVRVDEFFPAFAPTGAQQPLTSMRDAAPADGQRKGLGDGYVLGRRLCHRSCTVRATIWPADTQQVRGLLPGAELHRELMAFIRLYVGIKADVHLRMEVSSRLAPKPAIGASSSQSAPRLGWTTVLPADEERSINIGLGIYKAFPAPAPNPYLTPHHA